MEGQAITVYYFARCREDVGVSEESLPLSEPTPLEEVVRTLCERHPKLRHAMGYTRVALNQEFVSGNPLVRPGDELAMIPPVSGGAPSLFQLRAEKFEWGEATRVLEPISIGCGALATFEGIVRKTSLGKEVTHLEYEAYGDMAIRQMEKIAKEARNAFAIERIAVIHRTGTLQLGDVAVSIAVTAAHRAPALDACRFIIDRLKEDVPIWKREHSVDGETWWGMGP